MGIVIVSFGFTENGIGFSIVTVPANNVSGCFSEDNMAPIATSRSSLLTFAEVQFSSDSAISPLGRRIGVRTNETASLLVSVIGW